jgi:hypothetical protein
MGGLSHRRTRLGLMSWYYLVRKLVLGGVWKGDVGL